MSTHSVEKPLDHNVLASDHEIGQELEKSDTNNFPDGGTRAWLVAAGSSMAFFCTLGYTNSFGVFQAYYKLHQLPDCTEDQISWIGGVQAFLIFATGLIGGPLFDRFGAWTLRPAAVLYVFGIMMTSLCTKYWQFMLSQGIATGLATGLIMSPAMSAVPQWFQKKRGAAMGAAVAGSSIGGVIFPIMLSNLLTKTNVGFGWSVRIAGFITVPLLAFTSLTIRARLPPRKTQFFLAEPFKKPTYLLLCAAMFCGMVGMLIPAFLIPTYAISKGVDETLASYLAAVLNAASFFGRVIPGVIGDKIGRLNIFALAAASTCIVTFCWPYADSQGAIIVLTLAFGFCSGAIVSGGSVAVTVCTDEPKKLGTYMGMGMAMASFSALLGPPVSGAMISRYHGFHEVSYFGGAMTLLATVLCVLAKKFNPAGIMGKI
ncbi:hypothetical protein Golomagni_06130 [Golovinomyces magnicellulatus]|nr:hypothetical protein Golomagni_06130 [Golovinomyces magnicellulatus]